MFLSPAQAADVARRGRQLLQAGQITHHHFAILDALLWRCRKHGQAAACASYSALQRLCHMARETVWAGLRRLEEQGLVQKVKQRVRVAWASRQATSVYVFRTATTEFAGRTAFIEILTKAPEKEVRKSQAALARARAVMERRMLGKLATVKGEALHSDAPRDVLTYWDP